MNQSTCEEIPAESWMSRSFQIVLCLLLETVGNRLLLALIFYEKFGMDPQKRTLVNQLFSLLCIALIFMNLVGIPLHLVAKCAESLSE